MSAPDEYRRLMAKLLAARALAGGTLPQEVEADHVAEIDLVWWKMTEAEQEAMELEFVEYTRAAFRLASWNRLNQERILQAEAMEFERDWAPWLFDVFDTSVPDAPADLGLVDVEAEMGSRTFPRKKV